MNQHDIGVSVASFIYVISRLTLSDCISAVVGLLTIVYLLKKIQLVNRKLNEEKERNKDDE